jgi:tripartite ATP-independent transporter DctM subunit
MFNLLIILLLLIFLGVPIAFSIGFSIFSFSFFNDIPIESILQQMIRGVDSFVLLAVPAFIFAGKLMNMGGITKRLFKFANCFTGHIPGGLAHANVVASVIFAGMSGSAVADAGGLGSIEIEAMKNNGYTPGFSTAVTAASSIIGPIIPPSIPAVLYAASAGVSVGRLFIAGIIPGLLLAISMMVLIYFIAVKRGYENKKRATFKEILKSFSESFYALLAPIIIIGGIVAGIFTPTEAATIAVLYAFIISAFVYREINFKILYQTILESIIATSVIGIIISFSFGLSYLLTISQISQRTAQLLLGLTNNPLIVLLILNVFFLVVGLFMDPTPAILILTPILIPIVITVGIDPIHFGIVMILNLMIGLITPPVGMCLYAVASIGKVSVEGVMKELLPFFIPAVFILLLLIFFPDLVLFLPNLIMGG